VNGRLITVLYEDEHARNQKHFGPHMLLLACVADLARTNRFALLNQIIPIASGGDGNVKRKLRDAGANLAAKGPVVAMFDNDKVRPCYGLLPGACKRELLEAIRNDAQGSLVHIVLLGRRELEAIRNDAQGSLVHIVLLEERMEDLVDDCCTALKRPKPAAKPKPGERDRILQEAAADGQDAARAAILAANSSFKRLVVAVHALWGANEP
jgi:hypothetical protein